MKNFFSILIACLISNTLLSQAIKTYEINADVPAIVIDSTKLKLGGTNAEGDKISVNNFYVSLNNKPWFPVTGEFHFTRYPNQYWDEAIKKIESRRHQCNCHLCFLEYS